MSGSTSPPDTVAAAGPGRTGPSDPTPLPPRRPRRRRRWLLGGGALLAVLALVGGALSWRWFVRPPEDGPVPADAIVMFGGAGRRFHKAVALAEAGYAEVVVLSDPKDSDEEFTAFGWFCRNRPREGYEPHDYEAICFEPPTHTTRGESRWVADLARERGWETINLVTTTEQATRARMLLARCWDGEIRTVTVPTDLFRPARILYEWGALARATFERPGC